MRKRRVTHLGDRVYTDEEGMMFKKSGNAKVYLNRTTQTKIEARKRKK